MIDADFTSDEIETIGGLVLEQLDRAPERGDRVEIDGYVIEETRISTVRVSEPEKDDSVPE